MTQAKAAFLHIVRHPVAIAALAVLGAALVILAAVAGSMWQPARTGAATAEASLETAAAELRERRYRARLAADYATRLTQVEALEAKLRQVKSEPEFMRDIEALVAGSGAAVTQFSSRSAEQSAGAGTSYFEFYLSGSYASLRKFITALPDLNEFVAVERISLERNGTAVQAYLVLRRHYKAE
jgi:Tfp pilus assembly protein PilO